MSKDKKDLLPKRGPFGLPLPPDPGEIREVVEEVVGGIREAKEIPKNLMDHLVEAETDFKETDKALRGTRVKGRKRGRV